MAQCIYSDWHGKCSMYTEDVDLDSQNIGCDAKGYCWAEDDPVPENSCIYFEDVNPEEDDDYYE